jgi:type IV pilus assembly protein PilA
MKTDFQTKFLQHLLNKKDNAGFTLIELLVVIIIIGILSAIALPSFLNQANKAKQSEAKTYVGSMNRAQQAYYLEKDEFSNNIGPLGLGISTETQYYKYVINGGGVGSSTVTNQAQIKTSASALKAYIGGVKIGTQAATSEATTLAVLCEALKAGVNGGNDGSAVAEFTTDPSCPTATYSRLK